MIGGEDSDSDSGCEEVLETSSLVETNDNSGGWTPQRAGCMAAEVDNDMDEVLSEIEKNQVKPETMQPAIGRASSTSTSMSNQWTRHRSSRYRDSKHPEGYEYLFCADTGETKWVGEDNGKGGPTGSASSTADRASLVSQYPSNKRLKEEHSISAANTDISELSEGYIVKRQDNKVEYFCDQQKKWAFHTDLFGFSLLSHLVRLNKAALDVCDDKINSSGNTQKMLMEGKKIYSEKKHLIAGVPGQPKVTWSQEEYAHPGMQRMYLKLKSYQRFTETWAMLERSARLGLFDIHRNAQAQQNIKSVRVISIGGGPGYELIAFEKFFRSYLDKSTPLELISLDLMPDWKDIVNALNMKFGVYDIEGSKSMFDVLDDIDQLPAGASLSKPGCVTYVLISYVMIYVSTDAVCDMFAELLKRGNVHAFLVSERGKVTKALRMMENRSIRVHRLIAEDDERQSLWLNDHTNCSLRPPAANVPTTFPNQPFIN